ncbi:hypothetical protein [Hahella sp. HN01]|uniref:hypothetical protein n=1 Tax=unclassified Hahella TaxID=2624107 RepID=UPI001C1EB4F4|nr:hypothetical protein [Hahella sp. HN01]MBU6954225.1 hypothetical protein [Hahella sp. HN01]
MLSRVLGGCLRPLIIAVTVFLSACAETTSSPQLHLGDADLDWVGRKVFQNECAGKRECLVTWNQGEAFPSLGIGHFIWYPAGVEEKFKESFPLLFQYMLTQGVVAPSWILELDPLDAPWPTRQAFLAVQNSPQVEELRGFLERTKAQQVAFMFQRASTSLEAIIESAPVGSHETIRLRVMRLSETRGGAYALIDYVNFKGDGLSESERYKGEGWGLKQVLEEMDRFEQGRTPLLAFRMAAIFVLERRAHNAANPIEKEKWLPGWKNRLTTYTDPEAS